jgi:glycosyltransferase involved in cell wall biosynthesis
LVEALACGTPVLALDSGSVPEVVQHGYTGFIGRTEDDLVRAVPHIADLSRADCRADTETRFSASAMAHVYELVYARYLAGKPRLSGASAALDEGAFRAFEREMRRRTPDAPTAAI